TPFLRGYLRGESRVRAMQDIDKYAAYIGSAAWAEKREQRLQVDGRRCKTCHHDGSNWRLEVHHATYGRLGREDVETDLVTLCSQCHEAVTSVIRSRRYESRPVAVSFVSDSVHRRKGVSDGMEDTVVSDHRGCPDHHAQRFPRRPVEQGREAVEAGYVQTQENRRGL
ncbi:MAG: hypothetical protein EBT03_13150, partial [Betaproteobacteria bacterium]|nr:hypothetical protein [Betaproteobacteria bacterium]